MNIRNTVKYIGACGITFASFIMINIHAFATEPVVELDLDSGYIAEDGSLVSNAKNFDDIISDIGAASIVNDIIDENDFTEEEINDVNFWGYKYLGIAQVSNHLNVRETPEEGGKLVGKMTNNAACEILAIENGNWAKIKSGKVQGYACLDYLITGKEAVDYGKTIATQLAIVTTETLRVRSEPNTECEIVTLIPQGETMEVSAILDEGWVACELDDETVYLSAEYVDIDERLDTAITITELLYGNGVSDVRVDIVSYAKQFIGNPYVWGGTSLTKGTDCSGFTMQILKKYGVSLPHHAASQAKMGTAVSLDHLRPGDLVFYGSKKGINHVAIYIGNGQVCHASNKKYGIRISNLYYRSPVCARSYLK